MSEHTRRTFLATISTTALVGTAGCTGINPFDDDSQDTSQSASPPEFVSSIYDSEQTYLQRPHDIRIKDGTGYSVGKGGTFTILDMSEYGIIGGMNQFDNAQTVHPFGDSRCLVAGDGIHLVDTNSLEILDSVQDESTNRINGWGITEENQTLLSASKDGYVCSINYQQDKLSLEGSMDTNELSPSLNSPHDAEIVGDHLVVPNQQQGTSPKVGFLRLFDNGKLLPDSEWELESHIDSPQMVGANRVVVKNRRVFIASNYSHTLAEIYIDTDGNSTLRWVRPTAGDAPDGLTIREETVAVAGSSSVGFWNISSSNQPHREQILVDRPHFERRGSAHDLVYNGDTIVVTAQKANRVNIYEILE